MLLTASMLFAQKGGAKHWGAEVEFMPGKALVMDQYQRKWMRGRDNYTVGLRANYSTMPCDSDDFAADYNFPTLSVGLRYSINNGVTMYRDKDREWPLIEPVDYESRLGNIVTLYGMFTRPLYPQPSGNWLILSLLVLVTAKTSTTLTMLSTTN